MSGPNFKGQTIRTEETIYHLECPDCGNYFELMHRDTPCVICGAQMKLICEEVQERQFSEVQVTVIEQNRKDKPYRHMTLEKYERERKQERKFNSSAD